MITFDNILVFSLGGILGYLLKTFIEHRLARSRSIETSEIKDFNEAKRRFRSVIAVEIADLRTRPHRFKDSSHINILHTAVIEFTPFLSKDRQVKLSRAWNEYKNHEEYRSWTKPKHQGAMPQEDGWAKNEAFKFLDQLLSFSE